MCNLYAMNRSRDEVARLFRVGQDRTANQPPLPAIFPDQMAPVVHTGRDGTRIMAAMRWGFPPPPNLGARPVTNVRNATSAYWRPWLKPEWRCLVPVTSFCEYTDALPKVPHWFALGPDRPTFAFAGIWRPWTGVRGPKAAPEDGEHRLFAFLTTEPNDIVRPIHAKAMPVILTADTWDTWLDGDTPAALALQKPFPAERLGIVATGQRSDDAP
jgi:putative SOS response-associated peptidase YedK